MNFLPKRASKKQTFSSNFRGESCAGRYSYLLAGDCRGGRTFSRRPRLSGADRGGAAGLAWNRVLLARRADPGPRHRRQPDLRQRHQFGKNRRRHGQFSVRTYGFRVFVAGRLSGRPALAAARIVACAALNAFARQARALNETPAGSGVSSGTKKSWASGDV